jgi:hypothetical protein
MKGFAYSASLALLIMLSGCVKEEPNCYESLSESCAAVIEVRVWEVDSGAALGMSSTPVAFGAMPEKFLIDDREQTGPLWLSREGVSREPLSARPTILKAELHGFEFSGVQVTLDMSEPVNLQYGNIKYRLTLSPRAEKRG